jgi:hypothetical protein
MSAFATTPMLWRVLTVSLLLVPIVMIAVATMFYAAYAIGLMEPTPVSLTAPDGTVVPTLREPAGINVAEGAGLLGMLLGAAGSLFVGVAAAGGSRAAAGISGLATVLGPLAVAFLVARQYTYDPYHFPALNRAPDDGPVGTVWLVILTATALFVVLFSRRSPSVVYATTGILLLITAFTALIQFGIH